MSLSTRECLILNQTHLRGNQIWQIWLTTMHVTDNLSRLRLFKPNGLYGCD